MQRLDDLRNSLRSRKAHAEQAFQTFKAKDLAIALELPRYQVDAEAVKSPQVPTTPRPLER